ncbi:N-carbamoylputrescine amidase-like [Henckelia pumila]|uniref:N-carbamoylputrescine amidase-like n=1 Tax=Henckelia pumila TaxID=405737 RepID=UPI003C6DD6C6
MGKRSPSPTLPIAIPMCRMQNLAKELGVVILVGIFDETNNTYYNMIVVIDADGTELGCYHKFQTPNDPVFQTRYAKIGVGIFWDHWFPEAAQDMVLHGAEILFYPTVIGPESEDVGLYSQDHWKRVMRGHSWVNRVPLVGTRIGKEIIHSEYEMSENSLTVVSVLLVHTGEIVESADDEKEAILIAQFDLDELKSRGDCWGAFRYQ